MNSLKQWNNNNKIIIIIIIIIIKYEVKPKTFYFNFDIPRHVDKILKHEIECIIKIN